MKGYLSYANSRPFSSLSFSAWATKWFAYCFTAAQASLNAGMKKTPLAKEEDLCFAKGNLGRVLWRYFRYEEALEGLRQILRSTHLKTLVAMKNLASSYLFCGENLLDQAHELMLEVLSQRESRPGFKQLLGLLSLESCRRIEGSVFGTRG
jgi:hypothetical protein